MTEVDTSGLPDDPRNGADPSGGTPLEAPPAPKARETVPAVFGRGALLTLVVPFFVFLIGLAAGGWLDSRALETELEPELARLEEALSRTQSRGLSLGYGIGDLAEQLERAPVKPGKLREAGADLLDAPRGDIPGEVGLLAEELEAYLIALDGRDQARYPRTYTIVLGLTLLAMLIGVRGYTRIEWRVSREAVIVGSLGVVVWVGLWWIDQRLLGLGSLMGVERQGFNPFVELAGDPGWMWSFLTVRLLGLVVVVPVIEEFFLRGFVMRYVDAIHWDEHPLGVASGVAVGCVLFYAALSHPGEPLASLVWFGMVTWMYLRTRSLADCVVAHAVTNLLLGIFVIATGTWALW